MEGSIRNAVMDQLRAVDQQSMIEEEREKFSSESNDRLMEDSNTKRHLEKSDKARLIFRSRTLAGPREWVFCVIGCGQVGLAAIQCGECDFRVPWPAVVTCSENPQIGATWIRVPSGFPTVACDCESRMKLELVLHNGLNEFKFGLLKKVEPTSAVKEVVVEHSSKSNHAQFVHSALLLWPILKLIKDEPQLKQDLASQADADSLIRLLQRGLNVMSLASVWRWKHCFEEAQSALCRALDEDLRTSVVGFEIALRKLYSCKDAQDWSMQLGRFQKLDHEIGAVKSAKKEVYNVKPAATIGALKHQRATWCKNAKDELMRIARIKPVEKSESYRVVLKGLANIKEFRLSAALDSAFDGFKRVWNHLEGEQKSIYMSALHDLSVKMCSDLSKSCSVLSFDHFNDGDRKTKGGRKRGKTELVDEKGEDKDWFTADQHAGVFGMLADRGLEMTLFREKVPEEGDEPSAIASIARHLKDFSSELNVSAFGHPIFSGLLDGGSDYVGVIERETVWTEECFFTDASRVFNRFIVVISPVDIRIYPEPENAAMQLSVDQCIFIAFNGEAHYDPLLIGIDLDFSGMDLDARSMDVDDLCEDFFSQNMSIDQSLLDDWLD